MLNGNESWAFFRAFLKSPRVVASVVQSSSRLERRILRKADIATSDRIVEFGAGTGGLTRRLLQAMSPQARLLVIERTPEFLHFLERIGDPRLDIINGCASTVGEELKRRGWPGADAIVSGIPFSTIPSELAAEVAFAVYSSLRPGGKFVAYQISAKVAEFSQPLLGDPEVEFEPLNVPPIRVFTWQRPATEPAR